jgi:hypothetical protein
VANAACQENKGNKQIKETKRKYFYRESRSCSFCLQWPFSFPFTLSVDVITRRAAAVPFFLPLALGLFSQSVSLSLLHCLFFALPFSACAKKNIERGPERRGCDLEKKDARSGVQAASLRFATKHGAKGGSAGPVLS